MKLGRVLSLFWIAASWIATAQTVPFDTSGNGLLTGTYYFRQVAYVADQYGDIHNGSALYGNIVFDGNGHYSLLNATYIDLTSGGTVTKSGTYSISASGLGFISSPNPAFPNDSIYGLVSNGIFISSSNGNANSYNDLFIAAPAPSSNSAATSAFTGTYSIGYMNFLSFGEYLGTTPTQVVDAQFQLNPNGGSLGTVNLTAYLLGQNGPGSLTLAEPGVKYAISGGAVVITFPTSNNLLVTGQEYLYVSPDGNFVFGGAPNGIDMFVGVRTTSGTPNFSGLYYQAGLDEDESQVLSNGTVSPDGYYGSLYALPALNTLLNHQKVLFSSVSTSPVDDTFSEPVKLNADGTYDDAFGFHHVFGIGGAIRIGFGQGPLYGLNVALQAPALTGTGVYLNPAGIQNAASSALFTAGVSPGEYIELSGTGLASTALTSSAFPTTLNNVQVLINLKQAPIYVVSPTLIIALVPYGITGPVVQIQVINNNVRSNAVTVFSSLTSPGLFSASANGLGDARAQHASDFSLISPSNPAQPGENIILYLTGLGLVSPLPAVDGTPAGSTPTSNTVQTINVYIGGQPATISFAGLTPSLVNVYQLNVAVPTGITAGEAFVEIAGPDSDFFAETTIAVGSGGAASASRTTESTSREMRSRHRPNPMR